MKPLPLLVAASIFLYRVQYVLHFGIFSTEATDYDVLTITCHWGDGLFLNDYYVVGAIVDTQDLQAILGGIQR